MLTLALFTGALMFLAGGINSAIWAITVGVLKNPGSYFVAVVILIVQCYLVYLVIEPLNMVYHYNTLWDNVIGYAFYALCNLFLTHVGLVIIDVKQNMRQFPIFFIWYILGAALFPMLFIMLVVFFAAVTYRNRLDALKIEKPYEAKNGK